MAKKLSKAQVELLERLAALGPDKCILPSQCRTDTRTSLVNRGLAKYSGAQVSISKAGQFLAALMKMNTPEKRRSWNDGYVKGERSQAAALTELKLRAEKAEALVYKRVPWPSLQCSTDDFSEDEIATMVAIRDRIEGKS